MTREHELEIEVQRLKNVCRIKDVRIDTAERKIEILKLIHVKHKKLLSDMYRNIIKSVDECFEI